VPLFSFSDSFGGLKPVQGPTVFCVRGDNLGASLELGEPNNGNTHNSRSVWASWVAPATGIVTISTAGSGFDTLLGVYQGQNLSTLTLVENDDNTAGYHNSSVTFNAIAGAEYVISIGGFGGANGNIVLCFNLEPTSDRVPKIFLHPQSKTAT